MNNISNIRTTTEAHGNGKVVVTRWEYKGRSRHMSTLASATTEETFGKEVKAKLEWLSGLSEFDVAGYGA